MSPLNAPHPELPVAIVVSLVIVIVLAVVVVVLMYKNGRGCFAAFLVVRATNLCGLIKEGHFI